MTPVPAASAGRPAALGRVVFGSPVDLAYDDCNNEAQLWLPVPDGNHAKEIPADSLKAGQHYCMTTSAWLDLRTP